VLSELLRGRTPRGVAAGPREEAPLNVVLQILESAGSLGLVVVLAARGPGWAVGLPLGLLYLVHLVELAVEWRARRDAPSGAPASRLYLLYLVPGLVLLRRTVELAASTLFVRLYLVALLTLLLLTLPVALLDRSDRLSHRVGALQDRIDRAVEPLFDALLRAYNAISLNRYPAGETGLVLAVPMPFRERLL